MPPSTIQSSVRVIIDGWIAPVCVAATNHGERDRGGCVVEQAFGFDQQAQRAGTRKVRKAAMTETGSVAAISAPNSAAPSQVQPEQKMHAGGHGRAADQRAGKGHGERHGQVAAKTWPFELQRTFENQRRQQHFHDQLGCEARVGPRPNNASAMPALTSPTL